MDNTELRSQVFNRLNSVQEKYDYWLMAVAASAIALAVHDTKNHCISASLLPLGGAVASCGSSFFAGCRRQNWILALLHLNHDRLCVEGGIHPIAGSDPNKIVVCLDELDRLVVDKNDRAQLWAIWQFRFLVVGTLFYLVWHVLEICSTTSVSAHS